MLFGEIRSRFGQKIGVDAVFEALNSAVLKTYNVYNTTEEWG